MGILSIREYLKEKISQPESQRRLVLVVVSTALLLDNMLYMVIVPIIPDYLQQSNAFHDKRIVFWTNKTANATFEFDRNDEHDYKGGYFRFMKHTQVQHGTKIGTLFAFKAIVQLFVNPISGTVIDRVGYDLPMMIGLSIIFISTSVFAFGTSYFVMLAARGLQGVGSAFADTAGFAMIADRYTEDGERSKALGIALAFVSFGCLVAPPFGGIVYEFCGKEFPFITLAFVALIDGFLMLQIMQPVRLERMIAKAEGHLPEGTPIHKLFMDPYVAICAGALAACNISLAFLEPTISSWMTSTMAAPNWQKGIVWLPAFFPHIAGVYTTVRLAEQYAQYQWLIAAGGLAIVAASCLIIPFCSNFISLMIPICILCYGVALVDTAIFPTLAYIVDTRHVSVYGSVYAIADISYSIAYAFGPIIAGSLVGAIGFIGLNMIIFLVTIAYVPVLFLLRTVYTGETALSSKQPIVTKEIASDSKLIEGSSTSQYGYQSEPTYDYGGYNQGDTNYMEQSIPQNSSELSTNNAYFYGKTPKVKQSPYPDAQTEFG